MGECEHCGRVMSDPLTIPSGGGSRTFCSTECVLLEDRGKGDLTSTLARMRNEVVRTIEKKRSSRVVTLIHRHEMVKKGGEEQYITIDNAEDVLQRINDVPKGTRIDFIVHCPGGLVLPAEQIALALKSHEGGVSAIVPYYAMSGATLICLAADEILMEPYSVLGPLDPQIGDYPSPSLIKLVEAKTPQLVGDEMLILADIAAKALAQMRSFVSTLLSDRMGVEAAKKVAEYLTGGYLTHDAAITFRELKSLGLPAKLGVPLEVHRLMLMHRLVQKSWLTDSRPMRHAPPTGQREDKPREAEASLKSPPCPSGAEAMSASWTPNAHILGVGAEGRLWGTFVSRLTWAR